LSFVGNGLEWAEVEARGPGRGPYTKTTVISGKWEDLRTEVMRVW
jgi:hypothetical protein